MRKMNRFWGLVLTVAAMLSLAVPAHAADYPIASSPNIYIKRIVGLPGDILEARSDLLFVNGVSDGISQTGTGTWEPITVPPNAVFVMGDNRTVSIDSRTIGCIPLQQICVKVIGKSVPMP